MQKDVAVALIQLVGASFWPAVAIFGIVYFQKALASGLLQRVLPNGGSISLGDAKFEVGRSVQNAEEAADSLATVPKEAIVSQADQIEDENSNPYDLVMDTWNELANSVTKYSVKHGGYDDRRQVWSNLEILVAKGKLLEAEMGAVRDLQKARNSIRKLGIVDKATAIKFAETARRLSASFDQLAETRG